MSAMNIPVDGKRTLVTGDNFGIGAAIAPGLAAAGESQLGYVHMPGLGALRHAARDSINMGWRKQGGVNLDDSGLTLCVTTR